MTGFVWLLSAAISCMFVFCHHYYYDDVFFLCVFVSLVALGVELLASKADERALSVCLFHLCF